MMELLMVIALTAVITTAITTTVFQVFNINTRTANHMIAVSQVQQAGKLVSEDILEAQSVDAGGGTGFPLTLTWTVNTTHELIYYFEGTELWRSESIDGRDPTLTRVAEYINPDQTTCAPLEALPPGSALIFTVTATVGEESETRIYRVQPRSGSY
jgi:hypothetical protein